MTPTLAKVSKRPYTCKIIKASALLPDTLTLLAFWEPAESHTENLNRFRKQNLFGKASRARTEDILTIFKQRYVSDPSILNALVFLGQKRLPAEALNKILYFHACENDAVLHDFVSTFLFELHFQGREEVSLGETLRVVKQWVASGRTTTQWSDKTVERVAQHLLATLRDFGVLAGSASKRFAPPYIPLSAFAYVAFLLSKKVHSGSMLLNSEVWRLFLLSVPSVERLFFEAHQHRLLEYNAAGSVIRVDFPAETIEEYAHVILERSN